MRIAFVAPFGLRAKGTTRARVLPLARELARRGHTVAVFVPPYDSPEDSGRRWIDKSVDVINIALPGPGRGERGVASLARLAAVPRRPRLAAGCGACVQAEGTIGVSWGGVVGDAWARNCGEHGKKHSAVSVSPRPRAHLRVIMDSDDWEGPGGWNDEPTHGLHHDPTPVLRLAGALRPAPCRRLDGDERMPASALGELRG